MDYQKLTRFLEKTNLKNEFSDKKQWPIICFKSQIPLFFFSNFTKIEYTRSKLVYTTQKRFRLVTRVNKKDYKNQFGPTSFVECQVNEGTSYKSICQEWLTLIVFEICVRINYWCKVFVWLKAAPDWCLNSTWLWVWSQLTSAAKKIIRSKDCLQDTIEQKIFKRRVKAFA